MIAALEPFRDASGEASMLYYDDRGVSRLYPMLHKRPRHALVARDLKLSHGAANMAGIVPRSPSRHFTEDC